MKSLFVAALAVAAFALPVEGFACASCGKCVKLKSTCKVQTPRCDCKATCTGCRSTVKRRPVVGAFKCDPKYSYVPWRF